MLKSFREKEVNIIWSEWGKNPHSKSLEILKYQAQGLTLFSIDNGKLLKYMSTLKASCWMR